MRRVILAALVACAALGGATQARAATGAGISIWAEAGEITGSPGPTTIDVDRTADAGSTGAAYAASGWPLANPFPSPAGVVCPASGCASRAAGATATVEESLGILKAGAGASLLVGNPPDAEYGGDANVRGVATIDDAITLSKPATVWLEGQVTGTLAANNSDPSQLADPNAEVDVSLGFCCTRGAEGPVPIGGYDRQFSPETNGGPTAIDETFSVPVDLPAGRTVFDADLAARTTLLVDGVAGRVLAEDALLDFTGMVTFHVRVPDDVVATSDSGHLPLIGGAALDRTPPVSTATVSPAPNAAGWNTGPVNVRIAATDNSSVASITVNGVTTSGDTVDVPVSTEGGTELVYFATDTAGNVEQAHYMVANIDETDPFVVFSGNAGSYGIDDQVVIMCAAHDALSGVASTTCHDVNAPAYTFALGQNELTASAVDRAGNEASYLTRFTVTADPGSLAQLTVQLVEASDAFTSLSPQAQAAAQRLADAAVRAAERLAPQPGSPEHAAFLRVYDNAVDHLERSGFLTDAQATRLESLAAGL